jgi:dipeptide transport system substrate-binding protein
MKLMKMLLAATALTVALSGAAYAKQLVYCSEGSPEGFDPSLWSAGTTFDASSRAVYSRLVDFELGGTEIVPSLAESWDISEDGTEITFHLRKDVKWQTTDYFTPTRGFNADDVVWSINRQVKADDPWAAYVDGASYQYIESTGFKAALKEVVRVDDYTVKFVFNSADSTVFVNFPMDFLSIGSAEYAQQLDAAGNKAQFNTMPVGTGPFQFVDYQTDTVIRYKANPDYWKGKEKIDDLIFAITKDQGAAEEALKAGQCDVIPYPIPANIDALSADPNLVVTETPGENVGFIAYNTQQAPYDNPKVRQALNLAVNKEAILEGVYSGRAVLAINPLPASSWASDKSNTIGEYDPEKAKALLAEAGVKDLKMKLWWMPVARPYNPNGKRMGELLQADWSAVGVNVELFSEEWGAYLEHSSAVDRDGPVMIGWGADNADPDNFLGVLLGCAAVGTNNRAQWCYKPYDDLIQQAKATFDQAERTKLYFEAEKIFHEQAPWLLLAHSNQYLAHNKRVLNFKQDPLGFHRFDGVDVAE